MASTSGAACEQEPPSPSQWTATPMQMPKGKRRPFPLLELSQVPRDSLKSDTSVGNGDHESGVEDSRRSSTSSGGDVDANVAYIRLQNVMQRQKGLAGKTVTNGFEPVTPFAQIAPGDYEDILDIPSSRPQTPQASWPPRDARNRRASADDVPRMASSGTAARSSGRRPSRTLLEMPVEAGEGNDHINGTSSASASTKPAPKPHEIRRSATTSCVERMALDQEEDAQEAERISLIMRHLEEMNNSAGDLNLVQQDHAECAKDRQRLLQLWAVGSARLARAVGSHRLAKARPYFEQRRRCAEKQAAVEEASRKFLAASNAAAPEAELHDLAAKHALCLAAFQEAQRKFSKFKSRSYAAASPYFEAEEEHGAQLEEADDALRLCIERVQAAKARYRLALRSLEELSEEAHLKASLSANAVPASSSQASSIGTPRHSPSGGTARSPNLRPRRQVSPVDNKPVRRSAPPGVSHESEVYRQDSLDSQDSIQESHDASESQSQVPDLADHTTNLELVDDAAEAVTGVAIEPRALTYEASEESRWTGPEDPRKLEGRGEQHKEEQLEEQVLKREDLADHSLKNHDHEIEDKKVEENGVPNNEKEEESERDDEEVDKSEDRNEEDPEEEKEEGEEEEEIVQESEEEDADKPKSARDEVDRLRPEFG